MATGLALAGVAATFFRPRAVVIGGALAVSVVAVICYFGIVSSERLAAVLIPDAPGPPGLITKEPTRCA